MPSQTEIQQQITSRILDGLKSGVIPWRKPWRADKNSGSPANAISGRQYNGINPILLDLVAMSRGYSSRFWGTYQQWASLGAQVRKRPADCKPGCWGTQIVFYKQIKKTKIEDGEEKTDTFPLLRTFTVFNVEQVDGPVDQTCRSTNRTSERFGGFHCGTSFPAHTSLASASSVTPRSPKFSTWAT
jgi:antirestriction protein ArdC